VISVEERAEAYLAAMDGALQGSQGSVATFKAAVAMRVGFMLDEGTSLRLLKEIHNPKCSPSWSDRELLHKIRNGAARCDKRPGYLLQDDTERRERAKSFQSTSVETPTLDSVSYNNVCSALAALCALDRDPDVIGYVADRKLLRGAIAARLGAIPKNRDEQREILGALSEKFEDETLVLAGLAWRDRQTGAADLSGFAHPSNLLVIPWRDQSGSVSTLQRRRIDSEPAKKYVFTPGRKPTDPFGADRLRGVGDGARIAFVEGALDAIALEMLDPELHALGVPGVNSWQRAWAGFARGCHAIIALDADKAGDSKVREIAKDLRDAGAASVTRWRPRQGKDWGECLERRMAS